MRISIILLAAAWLLQSTVASATERAIIVLDASGSMWGQIDGTAKIEIARDALFGVVSDLDPSRSVGLMAYGHREKGQCSDIELIVEPQAGFARLINNAVSAIKPKGKTPLSDAVRQAAEALKYTEDKATVILITDGLETCQADPCALGKALEEAGVDFTAHVVGFGLSDAESREVACLADETGGLYLSAADGDELVAALDQAVEPEPEPEPAPAQEEQAAAPLPEATLTAPDEIEIAKNLEVIWEGPGEKYDRIEIFDPNSGPDGKIVRRQWVNGPMYDQNTVRLAVPAKPGDYVLRYHSGTHKQVIGTRPIKVIPVDVALFAPDTISMAKMLTIEWIGPGAKGDRIAIFDPSSGPDGKRVRYGWVQNNTFDERIVQLPAPAKPGIYELRYWSADRTLLASRDIEVTEAVVQMTTEPPIAAGSPFDIDWIGPGMRTDSIQLWDPDAGPNGKRLQDKRLVNDDYDNQRVTLPAPAKPGSYELRYWNSDNRMVLATEVIQVEETVVTLTPQEPLKTGVDFATLWDGPGARRDEVRLFDPNSGPDGKVIQRKRLVNDDYDNRSVTLPGPGKPGTYELRYWSADNRAIMASVTVEFAETAVSLEAPDTVQGGGKVEIVWDGPGAKRDEIRIVDPATDKVLQRKRLVLDNYDNRTVTLPAPANPGAYDLQYYSSDNRAVLASRSLTIAPAIVALIAPDQIGQALPIEVIWQGPGASQDDVQIVAEGSDKVIHRKRLTHDDYDNNRVTLPAPAKPGAYVLRYWNGQNRAVMATKPFEVVPIEVSLGAPDVVEPETKFGISWVGPGTSQDDVQIVNAAGKVIVRKRLAHDDYDNRKVTIKAPKEPGEYMLRYYNGQNRAVLFERPLSVN